MLVKFLKAMYPYEAGQVGDIKEEIVKQYPEHCEPVTEKEAKKAMEDYEKTKLANEEELVSQMMESSLKETSSVAETEVITETTPVDQETIEKMIAIQKEEGIDEPVTEKALEEAGENKMLENTEVSKK